MVKPPIENSIETGDHNCVFSVPIRIGEGHPKIRPAC